MIFYFIKIVIEINFNFKLLEISWQLHVIILEGKTSVLEHHHYYYMKKINNKNFIIQYTISSTKKINEKSFFSVLIHLLYLLLGGKRDITYKYIIVNKATLKLVIMAMQ